MFSLKVVLLLGVRIGIEIRLVGLELEEFVWCRIVFVVFIF